MAQSEGGPRRKPSLLFYLAGLAVVAGGIAAACASGDKDPGFALQSNLVYRLEIGLATLAVLYVVALILWLAWHGKGFFKLPGGIEAPGGEEIESAANDLDAMRVDLDEFRSEAESSLIDLDARLQAIEDR